MNRKITSLLFLYMLEYFVKFEFFVVFYYKEDYSTYEFEKTL